jgi:hypothetical protein
MIRYHDHGPRPWHVIEGIARYDNVYVKDAQRTGTEVNGRVTGSGTRVRPTDSRQSGSVGEQRMCGGMHISLVVFAAWMTGAHRTLRSYMTSDPACVAHRIARGGWEVWWG